MINHGKEINMSKQKSRFEYVKDDIPEEIPEEDMHVRMQHVFGIEAEPDMLTEKQIEDAGTYYQRNFEKGLQERIDTVAVHMGRKSPVVTCDKCGYYLATNQVVKAPFCLKRNQVLFGLIGCDEGEERKIDIITEKQWDETPDTEKPQLYKADSGKAELRLAPSQIMHYIAIAKKFGNDKYKAPDSWLTVDPYRWVDAMLRHALAFAADPNSVDEESGLPHLFHLDCNCAFLSEFYKRGAFNDDNSKPR